METTVRKPAIKPRKSSARTRLINLGNEYLTAVSEAQLRSVNRVFTQPMNNERTNWIVVLEGQSSPAHLCAKNDVAVTTNNWRIQTQIITKDEATVCFKKTLALLVEYNMIEMTEDKSGAKPKTK